MKYSSFGLKLPEYPWNVLAPYQALAQKHPAGLINLSIGTPIDSTPTIIQQNLHTASNAPGYPTVHGVQQLRETIAAWYAARRNVTDLSPENIIPTIGSKELVAWLPMLLGLTHQDLMVYPSMAYPTYAIGARIAGCQMLATDDLEKIPANLKLIWVNSPANPTGEVKTKQELKKIVSHARNLGAVVASDECYAEFGWEQWEKKTIPSILDPEVCEGSHEGLLSIYSLSKQSNVAGYRAAFLAGDPHLVSSLLNSRKHAGMIVPMPIQQAMIAALKDHTHVAQQKLLYRSRRTALKAALEQAGFFIEHSEAGLYLWSTEYVDTWKTVENLARLGIVVAPGVFYGSTCNTQVRIALTASDQEIDQVVKRLEYYP